MSQPSFFAFSVLILQRIPALPLGVFLAGQLDRRRGLLQDSGGGGDWGEVHRAWLGWAGCLQYGPQVP